MRASYADRTDAVTVDGVRIGYEVYGSGSPTILLMPTWTLLHVRFWKFQVPYLSRHYRVVTFDGPGNGRSERPSDPQRYSEDAIVGASLAVLDEVGVDEAIVVGMSQGGLYTLRLAEAAPERVSGIVLIGIGFPDAPPIPERASITEHFFEPYPENPQGWEKYNLAYWHDHYEDFLEFFFSQVFNEPHSTKAREDAAGWALETTPQVLESESRQDMGSRPDRRYPLPTSDECPVLFVHGSRDRIANYDVAVEAARSGGSELLSIEGGGHLAMIRDPVRFNLVLREFAERVAA